MKIAVVKYNAGNIYSVDYALKRLGVEAIITSDKETLMSADKIIFPGVGEAATTMNYLRQHKLDEVIKNLKQPVLGICLGMQLMCRHSEEGNAECLGIFDTDVKLFHPERHTDKVPHMGWNNLTILNPCKMTEGLKEDAYVYFVHSFRAETKDENISCYTMYNEKIPALVHKGFVYGAQFHPEKSGSAGLDMLRNFAAITRGEER